MSALIHFFRKLGILARRDRFNSELEEEMAFHREEASRQFQANGMAPGAAREAARREFGNDSSPMEASNEITALRVESVLQDVRYAIRQLRWNPGFTLVLVLTLALSIGANSAIFSVVHGVLMKSLPYPEAERISRIFTKSPAFPKFSFNPFDFRDIRERNQSFESLAAFTRGDMQLSGSGEPIRVHGFRITAGFFHVLGLQPQIGREFDQSAEMPKSDSQVILSDRLWRTRFGAAADILGRKITLNQQPFTVVGVMPPGTEHPGNEYHALNYGESVDIWRPFSFEGDPTQRGSHYIEAIGRLKKGVSAEQADAEVNSLMAQLGTEHPQSAGWGATVVPLQKEIVGSSRRMLLILLGAVSMVLLIACANAVNLLLARASIRRREIALRLALGASRLRLIRQLLTESMVIALLGGGLGLAMAGGGVKALVSLLPADFPRAHDIHVSAPVFAFTFLVSVATGLLFGLAPALQASHSDPKQGLHDGGRTSTGGGRQRRLRSALVVCEVGLACLLLVGAGLMLRSLLNLLHLDPGFRQEHLLTASLSLPRTTYKTDADISHFYDQLVTNLGSMPGVKSVGVGSDLPWTGYDENAGFTIEGKVAPANENFHARFHMASANYFRALGIPLMGGRFLSENDRQGTPTVIIINKSMADRFWPHEDPVGKRITFVSTPKADRDWMTVVGVVGDVKDKPNSHAAEPAFWWTQLQSPNPDMSLLVRGEADPQMLAGTVRNEIRRLDPALAFADVRFMDQIVDDSVATPRFAFVLVGLFAGLAIFLAAIGTYGVISYSVNQRTQEFGLRMALGAQRFDVLWLVLSQAAKLALGGAALGVGLALILARTLKSLIYEVSPSDPLTFVSVGTAVIAVALFACYVPAWRATKAVPAAALRAE
ncbi:MAG TPA: ABC transporter permease [Candidatus Angelobacter sp.]|nr:ABC transporter permease [Candidatus Angelobacter sp.]